MRILLSAYSCHPNKGSEEGNGWNWAIELSKKAEYVFCYTRSKNKDAILSALAKTGIQNLQFVFVDPAPFFERHYKSNKVGLYMHYIMWQRQAFLMAKELKRVHSYTIVHHVTFASLQLGSYLYKLNLPLIFGPVGGGQISPKQFKAYFGRYWKVEVARKITSNLLLLLNPGTKRTIRKASMVLVSNYDTKRIAEKVGAKNISLFFDTGLPTSFYPGTLKSTSHQDELQILWVGRLMPRKGLQLVLESLAIIKSLVNFKLTIVGDGEMGEYVNKWIENLELQGKVTWVGQVPFDAVKEYYLKSHLFILTSLRDSCPAQLLEAMAYGLPVVTLDMHGASIAVPNSAGVKIKPTTPEETKQKIAEAITYLSQNPEVLKQMGADAYQYALNQTWEKKVAYVYNNFYQPSKKKIKTPEPVL